MGSQNAYGQAAVRRSFPKKLRCCSVTHRCNRKWLLEKCQFYFFLGGSMIHQFYSFDSAKFVMQWTLLQQTTASVDNSSFPGNKYHATLKAGPVLGCAQRMMKFPFLKLYQHNTGRRPCNSMNTKSKRYLILTTGILLVKSAYGPRGPLRPELIPNSVGETSKSISIGMLVHRRVTSR